MSFFGTLFNRVRPTSYEKEFDDALKRTRKWQLNPPEFTSTPRRFVNDDTTRDIRRCMKGLYGGHLPEVLAGKCLDVALALREPLEGIFDVPVAITLGYVRFGNEAVFHTPEGKLKQMLKQNLALQAVNIHAWLKLPSHEIIDLTFFISVGVRHQRPDYMGMACLGHSDSMGEDVSYHPQLVGDGFLWQTGLLV
ncbi:MULTISPECIES: hypothetical protein [Pseudomonas]|uniref:Uncharacterized protein n=1 Tax=Pseudomonas quercus TaxID=2722792 RepID=A0ABX0YEX5_9PSED|nr:MULTISPECIES: hypothetical protein [Pseudomonas]MBF7143277.1 hypothetical protein [Pseudomonas sp. LY10J]NJP01581.1 hypothetical protein [Pseudomonas quercus]